jgi:hypothetical protein
MKRFYVLLAVLALVAFMPAGGATANNDNRLQAAPFTFVGTAAECAPAAAGSRIVTAAWLGGMGLPDRGGDTALNSPNAATRNDPHSGLLLSKNGPSVTDCSSAGARIKGVKGMKVTAGFLLGFDYRNGGHCGAGAPRFNVSTKDGQFSFVGGCANGTQSAAPQDPTQWTRVRIDLTSATQAFPAITVDSVIDSISILYDEGTDTANNDTQGVGLAVIDNIFINGQTITNGHRSKGGDKGNGNGNGGNGNGNGDDDEGEDD